MRSAWAGLEGVTVYFDGVPVGTTDAAGRLTTAIDSAATTQIALSTADGRELESGLEPMPGEVPAKAAGSPSRETRCT